jgi:hypothetical protein
MIGDPLNIEEDGTSIVVTMPGTDFSVTYQKESGNPQLMLSQSRIAANTTSAAIADFRARAFRSAVGKARELGWIV